MTRFSQLNAAKKTVFILLLVSLTTLFLLKIHPVNANTTKIAAPHYYPKITATIENAMDSETRLSPTTSFFSIDRASVEPSEPASPSPSPTASPSPSPTATPIPTDMKPLPTALFVAVGIVACVFGFGLIVNLVAGKKKEKT